MVNDFTPLHGFKLNVSLVDGKPSIFILSVIPEHIIGLDSAEPSGANVTLKEADGKTVQLHVTQSVEEVKYMMEKCTELDNGAQSQEARD